MIKSTIIFILLFVVYGNLYAKELPRINTEIKDTLELPKDLVIKEKEPHSPHKATVMSLILPGSGQVYNDQWWKVPILYAGIAADLYGIVWNTDQYQLYRNAYSEWIAYRSDLAENPDLPYPKNPAWDKIQTNFDVETDITTESSREWFETILRNRRINYKKNRDLCYIIMVAIYAVNVIDATVFAHFYDFEIDDNLSMNLQPTTSYSPLTGGSVGFCLTINF